MPSEVVRLTAIQCPRYSHCHGFLQILQNDNGKFLGCTSRQIACTNLVKIAQSPQQCFACLLKIVPVCRSCVQVAVIKYVAASDHQARRGGSMGAFALQN